MHLERNLQLMEESREAYWLRYPATSPIKLRWRALTFRHSFHVLPGKTILEARVLGRRWPLLLPEHLNYFNRQSLECCADRAMLTPIKFGRRRAYFSAKYVASRIAQHGIPGAVLAVKASHSALGRLLIPVSLGEIYSVCKPN
jgi:hypothetical protein